MRLFAGILAHLGLPLTQKFNVTGNRVMVGDLGKKFDPTIAEHAEVIAPFNIRGRRNIHKYKPKKGHLGRVNVWQNDAPLSDKKILVFGNSFFAEGTSQYHLTWWLSQYFAQVHFVWAVSPDWKLVDKMQPDILICQTIERFMRNPPKS
ncbi:hypothetical protein [Alteromonas ponticola]|uniref:Uncharacterized protein n=1 Tax=Alteromonas ponticola TaxID=2720613 RepID=A0ABX1QYZ2_9ALTE|nr:hypothetical protein [Alteromonas ponticola]NMH58561.1 hypothetical protein [Alteromonas ponticola]